MVASVPGRSVTADADIFAVLTKAVNTNSHIFVLVCNYRNAVLANFTNFVIHHFG